MKHMHTTIDIQAPAAGVWAAVRDMKHWSEWTPTVISIRLFAVGNRAIVCQPKLLPARWQIAEIEEGRSFRAPLDRRCQARATLSLDFPGPLGPLCVRLTPGLNARYLITGAHGLKKRAQRHTQSLASNS